MDASMVWISPETLTVVKTGLYVIGVLIVSCIGGLIAADLYRKYKKGK